MSTSRTIALLVILLIASILDSWRRKIPNWLTLGGVFAGLVIGWTSEAGHDILPEMAGMAAGFLVYLPLYLLRGMAAGDVKLMMTAGVFLGPKDTLLAALLGLIIGGIVYASYFMALDVWRRLGIGTKPSAIYEPTEGGHFIKKPLPFAFAISAGCMLVMFVPV